jgi:hypothetical protein
VEEAAAEEKETVVQGAASSIAASIAAQPTEKIGPFIKGEGVYRIKKIRGIVMMATGSHHWGSKL